MFASRLYSYLFILWFIDLMIDRPIDRLIIHDHLFLNWQTLFVPFLHFRDSLSSVQFLLTPRYKLALLGNVCL